MLRTPRQATNTRVRSVTATTGSHCPVSGEWAPVGAQDTVCRVLEGSMMPAFRNRAAEWELIEGLQRRDVHS
ncbi:hypothetical protein LFT45_05765 [Arthrobacter sp. FW305-BF8]|jgi:hypothetical protein|uniref:hypothetical protein n=1 Tax=Arthrobacter sp. FW305-BF8 TaxID=2879617 RepID=UPI001F18BC10|nr:hypothetical protein [Arthrobacter sp. FW305-BF8]UKA55428.1 hypothetical protein LFT45_05765 [Arthrobacter sp. FW305-BF8]